MLRVSESVAFWRLPEVVEVLEDAWTAVNATELPDELHPIAFGKAVDLLAQRHRVVDQIGGGVRPMTIPKG